MYDCKTKDCRYHCLWGCEKEKIVIKEGKCIYYSTVKKERNDDDNYNEY